MLPPTPPQTGLFWHIGDQSAAAEFRQATRAWATAYLHQDYVALNPQDWELHKQHAHNVDVLFIGIRLPTMARAREKHTHGPGPLRNRRWPWGLPHVVGAAREALEQDNDYIRMALSAMKEVSTRASHPTILLVAPEDRGGDSANLWQLPELRQFATEGGWFRYAFNQCELTPSTHPRPTAVLSLSPLKDPTLSKGWPKLKDSSSSYSGPLDVSCHCGQTHEPWSKKPRQQAAVALQPGVTSQLLSIARKSGLARHLRSGRGQARQSLTSTARSLSPSSSSASSSDSITTCASSPSLIADNDPSLVQWDDDAADSLGIARRSQDRRDTHSPTIVFTHWKESPAVSCTTGIFCGPPPEDYALPSCEGMPFYALLTA